MMLTRHFSLYEMVHSDVAMRLGLANDPPPEAVENLRALAVLLERAREVLGAPLVVSSGYRSKPLNDAIGGAKNSAHMLGLAADFTAPRFGTVREIVRALHHLPFDQIINEFDSWVHLGLPERGLPRREVLYVMRPGQYRRGML